jgi:hypothetical protein
MVFEENIGLTTCLIFTLQSSLVLLKSLLEPTPDIGAIWAIVPKL